MTASATIPVNSQRLYLSSRLIDPPVLGSPLPRTPVCSPTVGMDGHTLYFETDHPSFTLVLLDEEGEEVYSPVVIEKGKVTVNSQGPVILKNSFEVKIGSELEIVP